MKQGTLYYDKANATHDMIVNTGKFTVSVLSQAADARVQCILS